MQIEPYQSQPVEMEKYNAIIGKLPEIKKTLFVLFVRHIPIMIGLKNYNIIEKGFMRLSSIRLREVRKPKKLT